MTPRQCRDARMLLGWTPRQLADAAGCGYETIRYVEAGSGRPRPATLAAIRAALEAAGVVFGDSNEEVVRRGAGGTWPMTREQCRQARKLLGWHQQRLALQTNGCRSSVVRFEAGEKVTRPATVNAFRTALEAAGVEFIAGNGGSPGVRLRKEQG